MTDARDRNHGPAPAGLLGRLRELDFGTLRTRAVVAVAVTGGLLGLAWVVAADHAAESGRMARQRARIETAALGTGLALDGDALVEAKPGADGLAPVADQFARALELRAPIQVLRVDAAVRAGVRSAHAAADGALPVVTQSGLGGAPAPKMVYDLVPELAAVVAGDRASWSGVESGSLVAFAPVPDSFGEVAGLVRLEGRVGGTLLERAGTILLHGLAAGLVLWGLTRLARRVVGRHCDQLEDLARVVAQAPIEGSLPFDSHSSYRTREMRELAETVRRLAGIEEQEEAAPVEADAVEPRSPRSAVRSLGKLARVAARAASPIAGRGVQGTEPHEAAEPTEKFDQRLSFSPRDLVEGAVAGYRNRAAARGVEVRVNMGERVPPMIESVPSAITMVLEALVSNACKHTRQGTVRVRVTRELEAERRMRFEVTDTGSGIPLHLQPVVHERIGSCVGKSFQDALGGLAQAGHVLAQIDGKLEFESQPGHGSRFWFTVPFEVEGIPVEAA